MKRSTRDIAQSISNMWEEIAQHDGAYFEYNNSIDGWGKSGNSPNLNSEIARWRVCIPLKESKNSKYALGNLFVVYFDEVGTRLNKELTHDYNKGRSTILEYEKNNEIGCSGVLLRVVYNSKDINNFKLED